MKKAIILEDLTGITKNFGLDTVVQGSRKYNFYMLDGLRHTLPCFKYSSGSNIDKYLLDTEKYLILNIQHSDNTKKIIKLCNIGKCHMPYNENYYICENINGSLYARMYNKFNK